MSRGYSSQKLIDFTPATRFYPPNSDDTPQTLFTAANTSPCSEAVGVFQRKSNHRQMLIYTDGSCLKNGDPSAVGGCAFICKGAKSRKAVDAVIVSFRLEDRGPSGVVYTHTSNRAELRAVIACLQFCSWSGEGYNELVIATDSEYVVKGATENVAGWVRRGWKSCAGTNVKNTDLWNVLFQEIQRLKKNQQNSLRVLFWHIPREWNTVADKRAKEAATTGERRHYFTKFVWDNAQTWDPMADDARADELYGAQCEETFYSCDCCGRPKLGSLPL